MAAITGSWKIDWADPESGLNDDDILDFNGAVKVKRVGKSDFTWGSDYNDKADPPEVDFGDATHTIRRSGDQLTCNRKHGVDPGTVWTATVDDSGGARRPRDKDKEEQA